MAWIDIKGVFPSLLNNSHQKNAFLTGKADMILHSFMICFKNSSVCIAAFWQETIDMFCLRLQIFGSYSVSKKWAHEIKAYDPNVIFQPGKQQNNKSVSKLV
jgi:hypothetical protein